MSRPYSIRNRLAVMMAVLLVVFSVITYLAALYYGRSVANQSYDRVLASSALAIAELVQPGPAGPVVDIPYAALDMLSVAPEDRVFYRVFLPNGSTLTGYPDLPGDSRFRHDTSQPHNDDLHAFSADYRGDRTSFVIVHHIIASAEGPREVYVQVGQTQRARNSLANEQALVMLAPIMLAGLVALGLLWFGVRRAFRPVVAIGRQLADRHPGDLHPLTVPVPQEIVPLRASLNRFMERLEASVHALTAFIGDSAHQIRTPLAALRAQAQVAIGGTPAEMNRALGAVERNATLLSRVLNQMLADAKVRHRDAAREFEMVDLEDLLLEVIEDSMPNDAELDLRLDGGDDGALVWGDPIMLGEALRNIVHNAFTHGEAAAKGLAIGLGRLGSDYRVDVADRGPGLPAGAAAEMFDAFRQGADGRGLPHRSGAGLGLNICRRILETHGGRVEAIANPGGGLTIRVTIPVQRHGTPERLGAEQA